MTRFEQRAGSFPELDIAHGLRPKIVAAQADIEANREIPTHLVDELIELGMFRTLLPSAYAGSQLPLPKFIRVVEAIAEADGSTGWCVGQGSVFANAADLLSEQCVQEIWGQHPGSVVATGAPTGCTAAATDGGYVLSGKWGFASGCSHATWIAAMGPLLDAQGELTSPREVIMCVIPKQDIAFTDGWNVRGMRGTGSYSYTLDAVTVPAYRTLRASELLSTHPGTATGLPASLLFASAFGSVGLGIARRALDGFVEVAKRKTPAMTRSKLAQDELVQAGIALAEATWGSTRAFLLDVADECAFEHSSKGEVGYDLKARLRLAATYAMRRSAEVVDDVYEMSGTDSIFDDNPIQRCFQDIHALTQQIQGRKTHYRTIGRVLLGLEPDASML